MSSAESSSGETRIVRRGYHIIRAPYWRRSSSQNPDRILILNMYPKLASVHGVGSFFGLLRKFPRFISDGAKIVIHLLVCLINDLICGIVVKNVMRHTNT